MNSLKILLKIKKLDKVMTHEVDKTEFLDTIIAFSEDRIRHKPRVGVCVYLFIRLTPYNKSRVQTQGLESLNISKYPVQTQGLASLQNFTL